MIVLIQSPNGEWHWYAGRGSGDRLDPEAAFHDALYAHRAELATPTYGRCTGDDAGCWCGRPGHTEVNVSPPSDDPAAHWQGSNDGRTWISYPGVYPAVILRHCRYAREVRNGVLLRYAPNGKPPGAPEAERG